MLSAIGINPVGLAAQVVNFALLLFILTKFIYKPLLRLFDQRAKKIAEGLKAAEESLREKEKLEEQKKAEMKKARLEMERLLAQARNEAKANGEEIIQKAREETKKEAEKEYQQLEQKLHEEEKKLKQNIGRMVIEITRKTLLANLDQASQRKIIESQLKKLKNMSFNSEAK